VPLAAPALHSPPHHPAVASVIPGPNSPAQLRVNLEHVRRIIPTALWAELKAARLIDPAAPTP
jgi:D-threo-aldose 1-dehydrogenase